MNQALLLGVVRQHELTEAAERLNDQLRAEILAREGIALQLSDTARELADKARLLDLTHDAIIVRDVDGLIRYWNRGAEKLYGWSLAEALGKVSHELLKTKLPVSVEQMLEELHRTNRWTGELVHTTREGRRLTVFVRKTLDRDADGNPASVLENITNITERHLAEEALRVSEAFNRSIIESSPDCIKILDLEGNLLSMETGQDLLGIDDIGPFLQKPWVDLWVDPKDRAAALSALKTAVAGGDGSFVGFFRTLRGEPKWWDVAISPIRGAEGRPVRLLAVSRDVTERRALEESLVARAEDLARADRSKDEFLAMLAHELRNPLAPMRNASQLLQTVDTTAGERTQAALIIDRQIGNMSRMIDDLLDVSRITEGRIDLRRQPVALESILTAATSLVRSSCAAQGQELTVAMPAEPVFLDADATRLEQVFNNLLSNACKYSGEGSHISLSAERVPGAEPPEVIIIVRDDGPGIDRDLLPHVFELFVQATRSLDRAAGGLGIGLTLVQRLVKLHGGSVEARSGGQDPGSEFIVHLPILCEAPPPPPPPLIIAAETPRRILIVDDNTDSARSLAMLQGHRGHQTCTAFTGPDALTAAAAFKPEVVLLDIGLPGMDGFEVGRQIRAMPALAGVFLIAMSGYGSPEDRATAKQAGFDKYLVKPVDLKELRELLATRP
jgi:PAS domain S-box-containing protein